MECITICHLEEIEIQTKRMLDFGYLGAETPLQRLALAVSRRNIFLFIAHIRALFKAVVEVTLFCSVIQ
jgi:hypothetical protein